MRQYELIDRTDNDFHDTGDFADMLAMADELNAADPKNPRRWTVKPEGWSDRNFKG